MKVNTFVIINTFPCGLLSMQKKRFVESDQILLVNINRYSLLLVVFSGEQGWCSGESARLSPMWPGFDSQTRRHMWVEFVGSLPCFERFFSGYSSFPPSSETNISKFQFDQDYCQALCCEPLAQVMARALPVFDVIYQTRETVFHRDIQTPRRELKIRRAAEYF